MKEISIKEIEGFSIGQAEDREAGTGLTVILCKEGAMGGLDVRGGGPASREGTLLDPMTSPKAIHGVVLAGGSAFGLDAAGGAMRYLEERGYGFDVGVTKVPLVCQSDLFDLTVGDPFRRPDAEMAMEACLASENGGNYRDGCYGAGTGASVGKYKGMECAMKSGIGSFAVEIGDFRMGAVVAVNAIGDIYDPSTGSKLAGMRSTDGKGFESAEDLLISQYEVVSNRFTGRNTTLGAVLTNGKFSNQQLCRIARMAHDGYARCIRPVHTSADGDSIYALAAGTVDADVDVAGTLAAKVVAEAIARAVKSAESMYGLPAAKDLTF
ncbi:MAG: P1 family peptidase [Firmicutes bacterium]|nr:P1 family peptidase [Bacillota bacterium]